MFPCPPPGTSMSTTTQEILVAKGRTVWTRIGRYFCLKLRLPRQFRDLLHTANLRHGTHGFTSLPKESVLRIFSPWKILTVSARFEPTNLGTERQHATPRPSKPVFFWVTHCAAKVRSKVSDGNTAFTCMVNETGEGGCRSNQKQHVGHTGPKLHSNPPI